MKEQDKEAFEQIANKVCKVFGLPRHQLNQRRRETLFVNARSAVYYFLRDKTRLTYPEIGEMLNRDHATIINGVERAYVKIKKDFNYAEKISILEKELNNINYEQAFTRNK